MIETVSTETGYLDRLFAKFTIGDECWEWHAAKDWDGYGQILVDGGPRPAHRVMYELMVGSIPDGLTLDHLCRNRACVRADHLEPVTHQENVRRGAAGEYNRVKTHCPQGHEYTEENTGSSGRRRWCRICKRAQCRKGYQTRKRRER